MRPEEEEEEEDSAAHKDDVDGGGGAPRWLKKQHRKGFPTMLLMEEKWRIRKWKWQRLTLRAPFALMQQPLLNRMHSRNFVHLIGALDWHED